MQTSKRLILFLVLALSFCLSLSFALASESSTSVPQSPIASNDAVHDAEQRRIKAENDARASQDDGSIDNNVDSGLHIDNGVIRADGYPSLNASNDTLKEEGQEAVKVMKQVGSWIFTLATITMLFILVLQIYKLGKSGDDAKARKESMHRIVVSGIATAMLGSLDVLIICFVNL